MTTMRVRLVGLVLMLLLCAYTAGQIWVTEHRQANAAQALTDQRHSLAGDVDTLRSQVTYCRHHPRASYCKAPAAPPPQVRISEHPAKPVIVVGADGEPGAVGAQGVQGERGPGPTDQQTLDAVRKYMALHPIADGQDGQPGKDGTTPACVSTPSQCVGPAGPAGPQGPPGQSIQGPPGPDGKNGSDGRDGVGISSVSVNSACHLMVTYTDGHSEDAGKVSCPEGSPSQSATP